MPSRIAPKCLNDKGWRAASADRVAFAGMETWGRSAGSTARFWIAVAVAAGAVCAAGCRSRAESPLGDLPAGVRRESLNVLLVTLDTTRADRIGVYGRPLGGSPPETPVLDRLAGEGALFLHASSVTPLTLPAHATILTGLLPGAHGVRDNGGFRLAEERKTLAEAFAAAGFRTGGFVSAYVLDHKWGIAQGFERYFDDFDLEKTKTLSLGEIQRPGNETIAEATKWIDSLATEGGGAGERFFAWVHLYDPHTPHTPPEPWKSRYPGALYNAEVAWTDSLVGRLLDHLEGRGLRQRTVVMVVGDHGESLGDHGEAEHGFFIYRPTSWVPLIVDAPFAGARQRVVSTPVGQQDLAPTLLELAGVAGGLEQGQGSSLVPLLAGGVDPPGSLPRGYSEIFLPRLHYGWSELRSLRRDRWHFIEAPRAELYDIAADPGENHNLADAERRVVRELRAELAALDATVQPPAAGSAPVEEDEETMRALAALGYIGGQAPDTDKSFRDLPDPKDRLDVYAKMSRARGLSRAKDSAEAITLLREVLAEDPEVVDAWFTLGNVYFRQSDWERAAENYRETLKRRPEHDWAMIGLADTFVARGDIDAAVTGYRRYLEADPKNAQILYRLAQVELDAGRDADAERGLKQTLEVEPKTARAEVGLAVVAFRRQDAVAAHAALDRALAIDPKAKHARYNRALLFEAEGRAADAAAAYRQEIADHPTNFKAFFNLGRLLEATGDPVGALAALRSAVAVNAEYAVGRFFLARALLATGDLAGAEREARRGLELDAQGPFTPLGHYVLADVYSRQGRGGEAAREAELGREAEARTARSARSAPADGPSGKPIKPSP
ncbi:MAG: choline-sulfatase [Acidobacteriota bacterium]|nr:choline-sulfatase [Acidobacteriota bacterium]